MNTVGCPLCLCPAAKDYWPRVWNGPGLSVKQCPECEALFLWPRPTDADLDHYHARYAEHLASRGVTANRESPEETYLRRAPLQEYRIQAVAPRLARGCRALEVGGGCGNFIGELMRREHVGHGILAESCEEHRLFAASRHPGLTILDRLEDSPREALDVVLAMHVLEHLADPGSFLSILAGLVRPGGLVVIETPSAADPLLSLHDCPAFKDFTFQPMHPFVFHQHSLERIANTSGLDTVEFVHVQRYGLDNHLGWLTHGKHGGIPSLKPILIDTDQAYRCDLERNRTTDTLFGFFTKPRKG